MEQVGNLGMCFGKNLLQFVRDAVIDGNALEMSGGLPTAAMRSESMGAEVSMRDQILSDVGCHQ